MTKIMTTIMTTTMMTTMMMITEVVEDPDVQEAETKTETVREDLPPMEEVLVDLVQDQDRDVEDHQTVGIQEAAQEAEILAEDQVIQGTVQEEEAQIQDVGDHQTVEIREAAQEVLTLVQDQVVEDQPTVILEAVQEAETRIQDVEGHHRTVEIQEAAQEAEDQVILAILVEDQIPDQENKALPQ